MTVIRLTPPGTGNPGEPGDAHLADMARLAAGIAHVPWFSAVGQPLTDADEGEALLYLRGLEIGGLGIGADGIGVSGVDTWPEARAIADDPDWDHRWWDAEEALRTDLTRAAEEMLGRDRLHRALTAIGDAATDIVQGAAAVAAARDGIAQPALIKSAAGAATLACHHAGLALASHRKNLACTADPGPDHAFPVKFRLFEAGRWPLGIVGGVFYLF